jgi:hypothetical protein
MLIEFALTTVNISFSWLYKPNFYIFWPIIEFKGFLSSWETQAFIRPSSWLWSFSWSYWMLSVMSINYRIVWTELSYLNLELATFTYSILVLFLPLSFKIMNILPSIMLLSSFSMSSRLYNIFLFKIWSVFF